MVSTNENENWDFEEGEEYEPRNGNFEEFMTKQGLWSGWNHRIDFNGFLKSDVVTQYVRAEYIVPYISTKDERERRLVRKRAKKGFYNDKSLTGQRQVYGICTSCKMGGPEGLSCQEHSCGGIYAATMVTRDGELLCIRPVELARAMKTGWYVPKYQIKGNQDEFKTSLEFLSWKEVACTIIEHHGDVAGADAAIDIRGQSIQGEIDRIQAHLEANNVTENLGLGSLL